MPLAFARPPVAVVVQQHSEESAHLRHVRSVLVRAPHVELHRLRRLDDRIAAHLDGLAVAGSYGTALCTQALERPGAGEVFAASVRAIESRDDAALDRLQALAAVLPDAYRGLLSALAWVSAADLRGIVKALLASPDPLRRTLGLAACRLQRADPGTVLGPALQNPNPALRGEALRVAGELARSDLLPQLLGAVDDEQPVVAWRAAAAACMLGDRGLALERLEQLAQSEGPECDAASALLLVACPFMKGRALVRAFAKSGPPGPALQRRVIRACGLLGDAAFVPWLIEQMDDDVLARIAGESFTLISGADLAKLDLERKPPQLVPGGPSEDPADDNVALDEDESLPWPDKALVQRWWQAHSAGMPADSRCFIGAAPTSAHCLQVLREGGQRQRLVAAWHRSLLQPGTPLFPVCAPAWRQQRLLAAE